ncbi:hypothetical protein EGW08_001490, partial [Elysia chlorotica]
FPSTISVFKKAKQINLHGNFARLLENIYFLSITKRASYSRSQSLDLYTNLSRNMKFQVAFTSLVPLSFAISTVLLLIMGEVQSGPEEDYIDSIVNSFSRMNHSQRIRTWHTDCHRRCNRQLFSHVEAACENDPYRLVTSRKRSRDSDSHSSSDQKAATDIVVAHRDKNKSVPFLPKDVASVFLQKRLAGPGTGPQRVGRCTGAGAASSWRSAASARTAPGRSTPSTVTATPAGGGREPPAAPNSAPSSAHLGNTAIHSLRV